MKAKDIMQTAVITVREQATIEEIAKLLIDNKISGIPVLNEGHTLVGIVTEGDLVHKETSPRLPNFINILGAIIYYNGIKRYDEDFKKLLASKASEIMTKKIVVAAEDMEVSEIGKLLIEHDIKQIPVMRGEKIVGMISRTDIIKTLLL
jgi:CBS domain-containing protein